MNNVIIRNPFPGLRIKFPPTSTSITCGKLCAMSLGLYCNRMGEELVSRQFLILNLGS